MMARREKWEQHPANVLEAAYVNLAFATAHIHGNDAAEEVLEEARELMPSSTRLTHALARLHLWNRQAPQADRLYKQLAETGVDDAEVAHEVELYLRGGKIGRQKS
jgi:Tfp pilus assembly protein PilF